MTLLRVDPAAMNAATSDMAAAARQAGNRLDVLEQYVQRLIDSGWQGEARHAYAAAKLTWDAAIADMLTLLAQNAAAVSEAGQAFRDTDVKNAGLFG